MFVLDHIFGVNIYCRAGSFNICTKRELNNIESVLWQQNNNIIQNCFILIIDI